jgi:hypothetical protein
MKTVSRYERICVAALVLIFIGFTWRALTMFYTGDDMMNTYIAWTTPALKIWKAQILPWMPIYRPLGTAIYRVFYHIFGYHPLPLYIFGWLLLVGNVFVAWRFFRAAAPSVFVALLALSLTLVHGSFQDLYLSFGTIYDRLCFLFTLLAVIVYARTRSEGREISPGRVALLCFIYLMAMNSKESGSVVPGILFGYECIYCLPDAWRDKKVREWIRSIAPLYCLLGCMAAAFFFGRIRGNEALAANATYQPHSSFGFWLTSVARYLGELSYRAVHFTHGTTVALLAAMLALAALLRNRAMLFGWLFFVLAITPVALISARQGFVLYVPYSGLGLYAAGLIGMAAISARAQTAILVSATVLMTWIHVRHWPQPWVVQDRQVWRLTDTMRRDYPNLQRGATFLFASDYGIPGSYDAMFILQLLYDDPTIQVAKVHGPPGEEADFSPSHRYDHVFATGGDTYVELDPRNPEESIRLNILKDYAPGRAFNTDHADGIGYVVSGLLTAKDGSAGWWTEKTGTLKFDVYPADSVLSLDFFVPHEVARGKQRWLSVLVDGETVGTVDLTKEGRHHDRFPVPARAIAHDKDSTGKSGFTIVELNVDDPYSEGEQQFGVVLVSAVFDYVK